MAVNNLGWFPFAEDIHLAPGFVSPRLLQSLRIFDDAFGPEGEQGDSQAVHDAGIQVTFSSTPAAVGTGPRKITADPVTGEVKVPDPLPPLPAGTDWPQTMIVKAKVSNFAPEIPMRMLACLHGVEKNPPLPQALRACSLSTKVQSSRANSKLYASGAGPSSSNDRGLVDSRSPPLTQAINALMLAR